MYNCWNCVMSVHVVFMMIWFLLFFGQQMTSLVMVGGLNCLKLRHGRHIESLELYLF